VRLEDAPAHRPLAIAVLPFADLAGSPSQAWIGTLLQETLIWDLRRTAGVRTFDAQELVEHAGLSSRALSSLPPERLVALRFGSDVVVTGRYRTTGGSLTLELQAIDVLTARSVAQRSVEVELPAAPAALTSMLAEMAPGLGIPAAATGPWRLAVPSLERLEAVGRAMELLADATVEGGPQALASARDRLQRAVAVYPSDTEARYRLGQVLNRTGGYQAAVSVLRDGLDRTRAQADNVLTSAILNEIGQAYIQLGQAKEAEPHYREALAVARAQGDWRGRAGALRGIATVHHHRGEHVDADRYLAAAIDVWRALGDRRAEGPVIIHRATLRLIAGEYAAVRHDLAIAREIARDVGDRNTERAALNDLGYVALRTGAYREAQQAFEAALAIARATGDTRAEGMSLKNLGLVSSAKGDHGTADAYLVNARDRLHALGLRLIEVETLDELGTVRFRQGRYDAARSSYEEGLALGRELRVPLVEGNMLQQLGRVALASGRLGEAQAHQETALAIARRLGARRLEGFALHGLAEAHQARGTSALAASLFAEATAVADRVGLPEIRWRARYGLGRLAEAAGNDEGALVHYREAVAIVGELATQFDVDERATFLGDKYAPYDALVRLLLKLHERDPARGYDTETWAVLESKKGRFAADVLATARTKPQNPRLRSALEGVEAKEGAVGAAERALRTERLKRPAEQRPERVESLVEVLARNKREYNAVVKAFLQQYPHYSTRFVDQNTVAVTDLAAFSGELPDDTVAVQYYAAPDRLYLFIVSRGGHQIKTRQIAQSELYSLIQLYRDYVVEGAPRALSWVDDGDPRYGDVVAPLKQLSRVLGGHLLDPIRDELKRYRSLVVMPNDVLFYLPIHALTVEGPDGSPRFLAETHSVSYLTRRHLTHLAPTSPEPSRSLLALSNPDGSLPGASLEVSALKAIRPSATTLDGPQATKEAFKHLAEQFRDLHLATHGILDPQQPHRSHLLMAGPDDESRLDVEDIASLELSNAMVVLSACETALGEQVPGAALVTLAEAFTRAGARSIVASLWPVEDVATRDFMVAFHLALTRMGRAAALQHAQTVLLRNPRTAHPGYWAPFILIGAR
jgi:tetratricopeptide (TPR) repeat protein